MVNTTITITPTIPIGPGLFGEGLDISFWLPDSMKIDSEECKQTLTGLQPKQVRVIADCKSFTSADADKFIIPEIEGTHSEFWKRANYLPAILVSPPFL